MKTEKQINKLIDDLYFECIVDDQLDEAYQEGMQTYRQKLKESLKCLASDGVSADVRMPFREVWNKWHELDDDQDFSKWLWDKANAS